MAETYPAVNSINNSINGSIKADDSSGEETDEMEKLGAGSQSCKLVNSRGSRQTGEDRIGLINRKIMKETRNETQPLRSRPAAQRSNFFH